MFLPFRCKNPPETFPWATYGLIVANTFVFGITSRAFLVAQRDIVQEYGIKYSDINAVDFVASLFLHGNLLHLAGNMWFLYLFGSAVEGRLRPAKFLLLYFFAGLTGDVLQLGLFGPAMPDMPGIGASGAIMGLMGAALYMFPYSQIDVFYGFYMRWGVTTWHLRWVALVYVSLDMLEAFLSGSRSGVGNLAHLGGVGGGILMALILRAKRDQAEVSEAKATLAETKDYAVLAVWELEKLSQIQPQDTLIALHWMARSQREPTGPKPECRSRFFALLDRMVKEQPPEPIAAVLCSFTTSPDQVPPRAALEVGMRLESGVAPQMALQLYDIVLRGGKADGQEQVMALMRGGILCENRFGNAPRAIAAYEEVLRRDPMGPFADQARHRLESLKRAGKA